MLVAAALVSVVGVAIGGGGAAPQQSSLADALHTALTAPQPAGVTARVQLTNNLFAGATTDASSGLLKGGSGRLWAAPGKLRLEVQSDNGDSQLVVSGDKGYVYDGPTDTTYTFTLPAHSGSSKPDSESNTPPSLTDITKRIADARKQAAISDPAPGVLAGQPAYTVRATPLQNGGLLGAAEVAWDAVRGVPLRLALYPRGSSTPALELKATDISFGAIDSSIFDLTPPAAAHTVDLTGGSSGTPADSGQKDAPATLSQLPFKVVDPASLGSRSRREVKAAGHGGAVVLYGKGLDTVAVFEHATDKRSSNTSTPAAGDHQPLELPTVAVNGAKATAVGTPLGGFVAFERAGVSYTVVGSQPLDVLEAAARGL